MCGFLAKINGSTDMNILTSDDKKINIFFYTLFSQKKIDLEFRGLFLYLKSNPD